MDNNTNSMVEVLLLEMTLFFSDMVDTEFGSDHGSSSNSSRFYYWCIHPQQKRWHHFMPIRDLAAAWDATKLLRLWKKKKKEEYGGGNLGPDRENQLQ